MNNRKKEYVYGKLEDHWMGNDFSLLLDKSIILLQGNSGTGRSYLKEYFQKKADPEISVYDYTWKGKEFEIYEKMKKSENNLFVIDNADIILSDEMRRYIASDIDNQYLLIGREPRLLHLFRQNLKTLEFKNNTFTLADYV